VGDADRPRDSPLPNASSLPQLPVEMLVLPLRLRLRPRLPPSVGLSTSKLFSLGAVSAGAYEIADKAAGGGLMSRDWGARGGLGTAVSFDPSGSGLLLGSPRDAVCEARLKATPLDLDGADDAAASTSEANGGIDEFRWDLRVGGRSQDLTVM
jgi:hypothetical protein